MGDDSNKLREKTTELHTRIINGDVTARAELAELLLPKLTKQLSKNFYEIYDADLIDIAVTDALLGYFDNPDKYQVEKRSLAGYLLMSAKGDLLNRLKPKKIDENTSHLVEDVELGDDFSEESIGDIVVADELIVEDEVTWRLSPVWTEIKRLLPDVNDQEIARLIINGVRETEEYAVILGISYLDMEEQRDVVKKCKDRIKKILSRNIDPTGFRDDI